MGGWVVGREEGGWAGRRVGGQGGGWVGGQGRSPTPTHTPTGALPHPHPHAQRPHRPLAACQSPPGAWGSCAARQPGSPPQSAGGVGGWGGVGGSDGVGWVCSKCWAWMEEAHAHARTRTPPSNHPHPPTHRTPHHTPTRSLACSCAARGSWRCLICSCCMSVSTYCKGWGGVGG